jgi:hypothetical protein
VGIHQGSTGRNAAIKTDAISFNGAKMSTEVLPVGLQDLFLWSFDACRALKREVKLKSCIHASDFGIVEVASDSSS